MASRRRPSTTSTRSWFGPVKHSEQLETWMDEGHQVSWIKTRPKSNPVIVGQDAHQ
ncbi:hypothetical protein CF326_g8182, partial [Tilletia indica]